MLSLTSPQHCSHEMFSSCPDAAFVEGVNKVKRHTKPTPKNREGGIIEKEAALDAYKAYYRVSSFSRSFTLKSKAIAFELDVRRRVEILNTAWSADTDGAFGGESTYTYEVVLS